MRYHWLQLVTLVVLCVSAQGCTRYAMYGMAVDLRGQTIDLQSGAPVSEASVLLSAEDNGYVIRERELVTASDSQGQIAHETHFGWCRREGPLTRLRDRPENRRVMVILAHPKYTSRSFDYTFDAVWQPEKKAMVIDLGTVPLSPKASDTP